MQSKEILNFISVNTVYVLFIIIANTMVQLFLSKKDIKVYLIGWGRDIVSLIMFLSWGMYFQIPIMLWQFFMTLGGYLCWKHEEKTGEKINQVVLLKRILRINP